MPPHVTCRWAVERLKHLSGVRFVAESGLYCSAPIPPSGQPPYINGVVRMDGNPDPAKLLAALHHIEEEAGRVRGEINAARTLDLDLIDVNGLVRNTPDPVLPHPRMHERGFVLHPLAEVAPGWIHPRLRLPVEALIQALPRQDIRRLSNDAS